LIATIAQAQGQFGDAENLFKEILAAQLSKDDWNLDNEVSRTLADLADLQSAQGHNLEARRLYGRALVLARNGGFEKANISAGFARAELSAGRFVEAERLARSAAETYLAYKAVEYLRLVDNYDVLASSLMELKRPEEAYDVLKLATELASKSSFGVSPK